MMETIMSGAQTAKRSQSNVQKYQDDMKGNARTGVMSKTQKSVKLKETRFSKPLLRFGRSWKRMTVISNGRSRSSRITTIGIVRRIQVTTT